MAFFFFVWIEMDWNWGAVGRNPDFIVFILIIILRLCYLRHNPTLGAGIAAAVRPRGLGLPRAAAVGAATSSTRGGEELEVLRIELYWDCVCCGRTDA